MAKKKGKKKLRKNTYKYTSGVILGNLKKQEIGKTLD